MNYAQTTEKDLFFMNTVQRRSSQEYFEKLNFQFSSHLRKLRSIQYFKIPLGY